MNAKRTYAGYKRAEQSIHNACPVNTGSQTGKHLYTMSTVWIHPGPVWLKANTFFSLLAPSAPFFSATSTVTASYTFSNLSFFSILYTSFPNTYTSLP